MESHGAAEWQAGADDTGNASTSTDAYGAAHDRYPRRAAHDRAWPRVGGPAARGLRLNPRVQPVGASARAVAHGERRRLSSPSRAGRSAQPFGALIAVVLIALAVGLIYVAQTIRLAATQYEVDRLIAAREDLARQVQTLESSVLRWGTEATALESAQRIGLDQLETRI